MRFVHRKSFKKGLEKLTPNQKKRVAEVLHLFEKNPYNPHMKNHSLHRKLKDLRAISVGEDMRITFFLKRTIMRLFTFSRENNENESVLQ